MKRFIIGLLVSFAIVSVAPIVAPGANEANAQVRIAKNRPLGALDTLSNTDTTTYIVTPITTLGFSLHCVVTKISGTVSSSIKIYGSNDGGTTWITTALSTTNISVDGSSNYGVATARNYGKYKIQIITAGTQSFSQRTWINEY